MERQSGAWSRPALKAPLELQLYFVSLLQMRCQDVPAFCTVNLRDCPHCPKKERSHTGCALGVQPSSPPLLCRPGSRGKRAALQQILAMPHLVSSQEAGMQAGALGPCHCFSPQRSSECLFYCRHSAIFPSLHPITS